MKTLKSKDVEKLVSAVRTSAVQTFDHFSASYAKELKSLGDDLDDFQTIAKHWLGMKPERRDEFVSLLLKSAAVVAATGAVAALGLHLAPKSQKKVQKGLMFAVDFFGGSGAAEAVARVKKTAKKTADKAAKKVAKKKKKK